MTRQSIFSKVPAFTALGLALCSCSLFSYNRDGEVSDGDAKGRMSLSFIREDVIRTKAVYETIDTNSFILRVTDEKGESIYEGAFGDSP